MQELCGKAQLLHALAAKQLGRPEPRWFRTGFELLDELAPRGGFQRGAVHELLWEREGGRGGREPRTVALLLGMAAARLLEAAEVQAGSAIVWSDPQRQLYPPALVAAGVDLHQLILLRPRNRAEELWAVAECLRCPGVGATVASIDRLNQVEARRLQLAAEAGGGAGLFLRPMRAAGTGTAGGAGGGAAAVNDSQATKLATEPGRLRRAPFGSDFGELSRVEPQGRRQSSRVVPDSIRQSARASGAGRAGGKGAGDCYAAATRWLIRPVPADAAAQRWEMQLVHGHGGRVGQSVLLEVNHETGIMSAVRPPAAVADRPAAPPATRATA